MTAGVIGCLTTPKQPNRVPDGAAYACDNGRGPGPDGKIGQGWPGFDEWWQWLAWTVAEYGPGRCLFAVAPDELYDPQTTQRMSLQWLPAIRALGVPAAFVAQDGAEEHGLVPWDDLDVLFLGGSVPWKLSAAARRLVRAAHALGKRVHMGKVNSERRVLYASAIGCDTADGTYLRWGPDARLVDVLAWARRLQHEPLFDVRGLQT